MLPTGFRVEQVDDSCDSILKNLFEHYLHDMAEWFEFDSEETGAYNYPTSTVWEKGYKVHLLYHQTIPMGFALLGSGEEFVQQADLQDVDEFFVVRRYRRTGVGRAFAGHLWDHSPGDWLVRVFQRNLPAMPFWRNTIDGYTDSNYSETVHRVNGYAWSYFLFRSGD